MIFTEQVINKLKEMGLSQELLDKSEFKREIDELGSRFISSFGENYLFDAKLKISDNKKEVIIGKVKRILFHDNIVVPEKLMQAVCLKLDDDGSMSSEALGLCVIDSDGYKQTNSGVRLDDDIKAVESRTIVHKKYNKFGIQLAYGYYHEDAAPVTVNNYMNTSSNIEDFYKVNPRFYFTDGRFEPVAPTYSAKGYSLCRSEELLGCVNSCSQDFPHDSAPVVTKKTIAAISNEHPERIFVEGNVISQNMGEHSEVVMDEYKGMSKDEIIRQLDLNFCNISPEYLSELSPLAAAAIREYVAKRQELGQKHY